MQPHNLSPLRLEELERRDAPSALGDFGHFHKIHTTGEGQLTSLTSTGGTTDGKIDSGLLRGTTHFSAQFTDAQGDYIRTLVITTKHGTLTLKDATPGNLNLQTGEFTDTDLRFVSGTGRFAHASGDLFFHGVVNLTTGAFVDDRIAGLICLGRKH